MTAGAPFDPKIECMDPEARRELQEQRLQGLVDRLLGTDNFQGRRLREIGVMRGTEVRLDDIHLLPTISKQDLWDHYPFGLRIAAEEDVVCVHGSSGTGGRPTLIPYTAGDVEIWAEVMARALKGAGATERSVVHNAYGYGLFTGGLGVHHGGLRLRATVIPMSGGMTERQVRLINDLRPDVLCCTPSYALRLAEDLGEDNSIQVGVFGAEPWTEEMRQEIERRLGIRALDIYGLSEVIGPGVACESLDSEGLLNIAEDHFYPETLDGELVFSTLTKTGMPLLRYRTGDVATLHEPAGERTLRRMSKLKGRKDDMLVIRGVNVFPTEIEAVVLEHASPHYLIVEDRRTTTAQLHVAVESTQDIGNTLTHKLKERLGVTCRVHVLEPGKLPRTEVGKAQRLARWTQGQAPIDGLT
ncbi:phenylacetate--CoA ligase family protein [Lentzea flava]|uniref:Phenylacetate-coenzyme A ligase n=1 Tax=Lentzea flava TaxID=103732 RepID=A0ABQ2UQ22_9PSEU|nr:phenylacetate--CoA ligase [Lentzea flava]MCP2201127.1 phenylacetate-CoA ligase [Lentzea flava]GGU48267.1 phenylacetate-coenzyme A ligase [Lentzea flava]